jgi:hypothetical protein
LDTDLAVLFAAPAAAPPRSFAALTALPAAFFKSEPLVLASFLLRVAAAFFAAALRSAFVCLAKTHPLLLSRSSVAPRRAATPNSLKEIDREQNQNDQNKDSDDGHWLSFLLDWIT